MNKDLPRVEGFELLEVLGTGGMGTVFRARQLEFDREVALKLIHPHLARDPAFSERFRVEMRTAVSLQHPNIVPVYRTGESQAGLFIAMLLVRGSDLATIVNERGPMEPREAVTIVTQIAGALDEAHSKRLVHRDVKPQNILVDERLTHAYLTDFGLARSLDTTRGLTATGTRMGTIDYMPPEQFEGREVGPAADIYALGCVLYALLTGERPFSGDSDVAVIRQKMNGPSDPSLLGFGFSDSMAGVVKIAQAEVPSQRFTSAGELALAAAVALDPGATRPSSARREASRTKPHGARASAVAQPPTKLDPPPSGGSRRLRWVAGVTLLVLVVAGVAAAVALLVSGKSSNEGSASAGATTQAETLAQETTARREPRTTTVTETTVSEDGAGSGDGSPPSTRQTYDNYAATLYSADVPSGWTAESLDQENSGRLTSQWRDPSDPNTSVLVDVQPSAPNVSATESASSVRSQTAQTPGYQEVSFTPTTVNGAEAVEWVFDVPGDRRVDYFFESCGEGYAVLGSTSPEDFESKQEIFRHVAESVTPFCE